MATGRLAASRHSPDLSLSGSNTSEVCLALARLVSVGELRGEGEASESCLGLSRVVLSEPQDRGVGRFNADRPLLGGTRMLAVAAARKKTRLWCRFKPGGVAPVMAPKGAATTKESPMAPDSPKKPFSKRYG